MLVKDFYLLLINKKNHDRTTKNQKVMQKIINEATAEETHKPSILNPTMA